MVQFECWGCWCGLLLSGPSLPALFFPSCQISPHLFIHSSYLRPVWHCCNDSPWEMYNWICKFPHGSLLFNVCSWVSTVCMADWKRVKIWIISVLFPWLYYYVVAKKKRTSKMVWESCTLAYNHVRYMLNAYFPYIFVAPNCFCKKEFEFHQSFVVKYNGWWIFLSCKQHPWQTV